MSGTAWRSTPQEVTCAVCGQRVAVMYRSRGYGEYRLDVHYGTPVTIDDPNDPTSIVTVMPRCPWSKALVTAEVKS